MAARRRLVWPNGSVGYCFSSEDPDGLRGHQFDAAWSDDNVDFVGVDYYPPLADWRDGFAHADLAAGWTSVYQRDYIQSNIEGGENFDWYYASAADRDGQVRTPITDGVYNQPWVWRAKDIRSWWANAHHHRPGGVRQSAPTPWLAGMKPFRFTELGAPAVDKGANQPNVFVDPKSAESALPYYSSGARDDLAQRRTLEAVHAYWRDPAHNPQSSFDGRLMIETDKFYVYAFDARPYPFFPARADIWGDAANWPRGHWLNGRLTRAPLDLLVRALCAEGEVTTVDAAALKGALAGYVVDRPMSPRQMIDPLADVFQFDMAETAGVLRFFPRGGPPAFVIADAGLVAGDKAAFSVTLGQQSDTPSAVRLGFIDEGADYLPAIAEARNPYTTDIREIGVELPGVFDEGTAAARARSILADAAVMRETISFALPHSLAAVEPGDAVSLAAGGPARDWRILSITDGAARKIEAVRVAPGVYDAPIATGGFKPPALAPVFGKPAFELMNLPLVRDDDDAAAPYFACFADPWPGALALYRDGAALAATASARAVIGRLESDLAPGVSGRWDARTVRIRLSFGALASRSEAEVLAGANAFAVETATGWEVAQFRDAVLDVDGAWVLSGFLRGQSGTEEQAAVGAPAGARFVLLGAAVGQAGLPFDLRGLPFDWSAGPADDPPGADTFSTKTFVATARGLAPLSPVHARARLTAGGDIALTWLRRTRLGGDSWAGEDAPLGEAYERYRVEISNGATLVRMAETTTPAFTYDAAMIASDFTGARPPLIIRIAQLSDLVGPGGWAEVMV
ncbi:MAG: glycoside hydrolase TIM-barrel-like domain-containing protein [Parvularculaceae bacterium]